MYKNNLILFIYILFFVLISSTQAQESGDADCTYSQVELGKKKHIALIRTDAEMVDSFTTMEKGRVVDFSLVNSKGIIVLNVEVYKDAKEKLNPICIGKGATLTLKLENGETVILPQVGMRLCGINLDPVQEGFFNIKNRGSFLITEDKFVDLKDAELISARLKADDFDLYIVFNSAIYDDVSKKELYPSSYFQRTLDCVVNPTIIVQE